MYTLAQVVIVDSFRKPVGPIGFENLSGRLVSKTSQTVTVWPILISEVKLIWPTGFRAVIL